MQTPQEIEHRLARHAREHQALARLSEMALRDYDLRTLIDEIVAVVIDTLELKLCGVSALRADEQALDVIVSVGQPNHPRLLPAGRGTQAGYALLTRQPVISEDLRTEERFDTRGLRSMGMLSGVSTIIEGRERPFGILSAHTTVPRHFGCDDVHFLVAVANVLSAAVERNRREEAALHAALHDPLTGLPNRTLALDRLDLALARRRRSGEGVALLLVDLDRFTLINDSLGHAAGDEALRVLAGRLRQTLRASDTVARMSADEFAVVCEGEHALQDYVELVRRLEAELARPLTLRAAGKEHAFSASVGIAVAESHEDSAASMLRDADAALHRAKQRGPGSHELFDEAMRMQVVSALRAETELRRAIREEQLCVHYQPIVEIASGRPIAVEALVRWQHPEHGLIPPLDFIPVAEETGLIGELGSYVLERACAQGTLWQRELGAPLVMLVNVSGVQIDDAAFAERVQTAAERSGLRAGTLGLEVTESVLIDERGSAAAVLATLRERRLRLVLDDFGTGYSALSYLRSFPLDGVKIDRSFIDGLCASSEDSAIVKAIVEMCSALELRTVAEGVESEEQLARVRELGCDYAQGYFVCRPLPALEIGEFLRRRFAAAAPAKPSRRRGARAARSRGGSRRAVRAYE
ncbi:MAG TPA: GGDEF domain-containing protein [Solirubrobacteraceae bacterium]|nr:GGDEF domain-containing protein [Solirubrobacteraceae bacterium]